MKEREFYTPDGAAAAVWNKIPGAVKAAFFGSIVIGLMTHLYQFTNKLYNYDELANTPNGYGVGAESGRWFLKILGDKFAIQFGNYSLPWLNGMIAILLLACSAALIADMFHMKSCFFAAAMGGFLVSFPAVISTFFFMYTVVFYSIAIFFSVLAAYFVIRFPKNLLLHAAAVLLIACSVGIYQAYFANTACLLLIGLLLSCAFDDNKNWKELLFIALRYLAVLILGLLLYFILNKLLLAQWGIALNSYQGIDSMGKITAAQLVDALARCYKDFIKLSYANIAYLNPTSYVKRCFGIIMFLLAVGAVCRVFLEKGCVVKRIFLALGFALLPIAGFLVYIMTPEGWVYTLMAFSVVFIPIFMLLWAERFTARFDKKEILRKLTQWAAALVSVAMIGVYIWYGNGCYMSLEYTKYHDLAYYQTMVTQIKSLDDYRDDLPLALIGDTITDETNNMGSMVGATFGMDGKIDSNVNAYSRTAIIAKYLGFAPRFCGYEEIVELMDRDEVKEMSSYPDAGSVKIVDDVIVVKIME